jgi:hypothetical protein
MRHLTGRRRAALAGLFSALAMSAAAAPSVSPVGPTVPANLLRIELHLDQPVAASLDPRHVRLFDAHGAEIADALLDLALPSRDGRSVALLFQPGRIKNGVRPNIERGLALQAGERVTLRIDDPALSTSFEKTWTVTPAWRERIDLSAWGLTAPPAGSRSPLALRFVGRLPSSARQMIAVTDAQGHRLTGRAALTRDESGWRFVPAQPWCAGHYAVHVHPALEDVSGNRTCAPFESRELRRVDCTRDGVREFVVSPVR